MEEKSNKEHTMVFQKELPGGVRLVGEQIPYLRSVSVGVWIRAGSCFERPEENGISHFIEHMLFKGTKTRSARDISDYMDGIGGQINAFTAKECTCYYAKVIDEHIGGVIELLSDMLTQSALDQEDIKKEKGVIIEEIGMVEDTPDDLVHDLMAQVFFSGDPLAMTVLGPRESVRKFDRKRIESYMQRRYGGRNVVISAAGRFDQDRLCEMCEKQFSHLPDAPEDNEAPEPGGGRAEDWVLKKDKETEQVHLCLGYPSPGMGTEKVYALSVLNNIVGGGMSSRLFQEIREERGLAYSVYSYPSLHINKGMFTIYAGMNAAQMPEVIKLIGGEIRNIKERGVTEAEFQRAKEQLKGNYILGLESSSSRMSSMGKNLLLLNNLLTEREVIGRIENIKIDDVNSLIHEVFAMDRMCASAVGALEEGTDLKKILTDEGCRDGQA